MKDLERKVISLSHFVFVFYVLFLIFIDIFVQNISVSYGRGFEQPIKTHKWSKFRLPLNVKNDSTEEEKWTWRTQSISVWEIKLTGSLILH